MTDQEYLDSTQKFDMSVIDRRIFRNMITMMEDQMSTLKDSDEFSEWGVQGVFDDFKFVGEFRQWAEIWLSNLGTP